MSLKRFRSLIREVVRKIIKEDFKNGNGNGGEKNFDKEDVTWNPPFEEMDKKVVEVTNLDFGSVSKWENFQDVFDIADPLETRDSEFRDRYNFRSTVYFERSSLVDAELETRMYFEESPGFLTKIGGNRFDSDYTEDYDGYAGDTKILGPDFMVDKLLEWIRNNAQYSSINIQKD